MKTNCTHHLSAPRHDFPERRDFSEGLRGRRTERRPNNPRNRYY